MNENELPDIKEKPNLAISELPDSSDSIYNDSIINSKINDNMNNTEKENEISITISIDNSNKTLNFQNYINTEREYNKDSLLKSKAIENPNSLINIIADKNCNSKGIIEAKPLKFARSYSTANNNIKYIFNSPSIPFKVDSELKTSSTNKPNSIEKITSKNVGKLNNSTISTRKMTYEVSPVMNFNIHRKISITNTLYNMSLSKLGNLNNSILESALLLSKNNNDETSMSLLNLNNKFQKKNSLLNIVKTTNLTSKNTYTRKPTLVNHDSMFQSAENIALFEKHKIKKTLQIVSKDSSLNHYYNEDNNSIDLNSIGNMNKKKDSLINSANEKRNIDNQKEEKIEYDDNKQNDSKVREELSYIINKDKNRSEMSRRSSLVKMNSSYMNNINTNKTKNNQKRLSIVNNNNKNIMDKHKEDNTKNSFLVRRKTKDSYFSKNAISLKSNKLDSKMTLDSLDNGEIDVNDNDNDRILTKKEREEKILRILYSKKSLLNKLKLINRNDFLSYLIKQFDDIKKAKRIIFNKYNESNDYGKKQIQLLISDVRCKYNLKYKEYKLLDYSSEALIKYFKLIQLDKIVIDPSKTIVKNKNRNKSNKNRNKMMNVSKSKKILANIINNSKSKSKSKDEGKSNKKRVVKMNLENTLCISKKKTDKIDIKTFNTDSSHSYLEDCDENYPCSKQYRYFNTEFLNELLISYSSHNYVIPNYSSHSLAIKKILIQNSVLKQETILRIQSEYFQSNKQEPVFMLNLKKFTNLKRKKKGYFKNPNEYERLHDTNSFSTNNSIVDSDLSFAKRDPIFEALVISKYKLLVNNEPKTTINKYNKRGHNSVIFSKSKYKNNFDIFDLNIYSENEYKDLFEAKNIVKIEKKKLGKMSIRQRIEIFGHNKDEEEENNIIKSIKNDFERINNKSSLNIPYINLKRFSIDPKKLKREKYFRDEHIENNRKSNFGKTCDALIKVNMDTSMRKSAKSVFNKSQNENIYEINKKKLSSISNFSNVINKTKRATFNVNNNKILTNENKNADNLNTFTDNIFKKKSSNINDNERNESKLNKSFTSNTDIRPEVFSKKNFINFHLKNRKYENTHNISNIKKEKRKNERNHNNNIKQVKIRVENNDDTNKTKKNKHKNINEYQINKEEKIFSFEENANIIQFDSKEEINKITQLCDVIKTAYNENLDIKIKKEEEKKIKQKDDETKKATYDFNFDEKSSEDDSSNDIIISNKENTKNDNFKRLYNISTSNFKNNINITTNTKKNTFNKCNINNNPIFKKLTAKHKDNFKLKENSINDNKEPKSFRKINPIKIGKTDKENISDRKIANNKPKTQSKFFLNSSYKKDNDMGCNDKNNYGIKIPNIGLSNTNINIRKQSSSNMEIIGFNTTSSPFLLFKNPNKLYYNHKTSTNNSSEDSGSFIHLNHNDSYSLLKIKYQQLKKSDHQARCIKLLETPMPYLPLPDILKPKNKYENDKNNSLKILNDSTSQGILDLLYNNKKNKLGNIAQKYLQSNFADKKKYAKIKKNRCEIYLSNFNRKGSNSSRMSISHSNSFNKESNDNFVNSNTNRSGLDHRMVKISTNNQISRVNLINSPITIISKKKAIDNSLNNNRKLGENLVSKYNKDALNVNNLTKNTDIITRKSTYRRFHSQINDTMKPFFNKISSNRPNAILERICQSTIKKRVNVLQIKKIPYYNE